MRHIDDYLNSSDADPIAKEFLEHARRPAGDKDHGWLIANRPWVTWQGKRYRCVGASRMGDVWLKGDGPPNAFYDHRVDIDELSDWVRPVRRKMTLGRLILETSRGDVKERVLTKDEANDIREQLNMIGRDIHEPIGIDRDALLIDEPRIIINGQTLSNAQALTVRVALESLAGCLSDEGLGSDEHGKMMIESYTARINEIREIIFR